MDKLIWIPGLSHFTSGNGWSGSEGLLRFSLSPPVDGMVTAIFWQNPYTLNYAEELGRASFEATEEGLSRLARYLTDRADQINAHPARTPEELEAWHQKAKTEESLTHSQSL